MSTFVEMDRRSEVIIDVRSPGEYAKGHVVGAVNLPLFEDRERAEVGTVYVQQGRTEAIDLGMRMVGPRMSEYAHALIQAVDKGSTNGSKRCLVYCARGGMRSASVVWLLNLYGYQATALPGGYKAFKHRQDQLVPKAHLVVIEGMTGVGKTFLLERLTAQGAQCIDLEGLAKHRGSAFGYLPDTVQPSSEMMTNLLIHELERLDLSRPIFIEGESKKVGRVDLPDLFFEKMRGAPRWIINAPLDYRVERIVGDYAIEPNEMLITAFEKIRKRLGGDRTNLALDALRQGDRATAVRIALLYYDKAYHKSADDLWYGPLLGTYNVSTQDDYDRVARDLITRYETP